MSKPSRKRLVVVMDPIESIKPAKDSTLAILVAAQARGWELFYAEMHDIWLRDGVAWARLSPLKVFDDLQTWFTRGAPQAAKLGEFDVILMRKDPPFDTEYIYSTYILERAQIQGALVCNSPQGLRDMNEKVYTAWFPECCAPTLITRDMHDMSEFLREYGKAVCKPLDGMGGKSIFVLDQGDKNRNVVFETLTGYGTRYAIV
jgi:glutathione synthase